MEGGKGKGWYQRMKAGGGGILNVQMKREALDGLFQIAAEKETSVAEIVRGLIDDYLASEGHVVTPFTPPKSVGWRKKQTVKT